MLNAISWQQYLTAILLLSAAWYAYVGLRYYQPEILALLRITPKAAAEVAVPAVVMGAIKPETGTSLNAAEELLFSSSEADDISDQTLPKGPADELLAEAQILVGAFAGSDDKTSFLSLLRVLFSKYELSAEQISLPALTASLKTYAAGKLSFNIQADEWPLTFVS